MARIWVAMSGGVDSSVAAALLLEQGHDVTGVTMQLLPTGDVESGCCSDDAVRQARRVCGLLDIPHYVLNFRDVFEREVVAPFARDYACGRTPNPCVLCNRSVKFSDLLARVRLQGADLLATGHYARIVQDAHDVPWLARARSADKDQSYFLYGMTPEQLGSVIFPVGELKKPQVRAIAARLGLPTAERPESQDICFAAQGSHLDVVAERAPEGFVAGDIVDGNGVTVGRHHGIATYTVGQRKGIGIGGSAVPLYVIGIDPEHNRVVVGPREALQVTKVQAPVTVWRGEDRMRLTAVVRYRMPEIEATLTHRDGTLTAQFVSPLTGVARGQSLVCYRGDIVVGGGEIECAS